MNSKDCAVPGCETSAKPNQLMCRRHWFMVSQETRAAVWNAYRGGDKGEHTRACIDAIKEVRAVEQGDVVS